MQTIQKTLKISSKGYKKILHILNEKGQARLIGGCVRDALLDKESYDIDIATTLIPDDVMGILSKAKVKTIPTGLKFGTITAILEGEKFEITTLRKDIECNGRHAKVIFTSDFAEDAARRDFTINALSYCPFKNEIYDYFSGFKDLEQRKVVFIGVAKERIQEDYLRILRFFRFSSYYAEQLNSEGLEACRILQDDLKNLSRERIKAEMDKIIISKNSPQVLKAMFDTHILKLIFSIPNYEAQSFEQANNFELELTARYALLLHDINLDLELLLNWRFSRQETIHILSILNFVNIYSEKIKSGYTKLNLEKSTESARRGAERTIVREHLKVYKDDVANFSNSASINKMTAFDIKKIWLARKDYKEYLFVAEILGKIDHLLIKEFIEKHEMLPRPKFPLRGTDLLEMNIENKEIGTKLEYLKNFWIEQDFKPTKSELLNMAMGL
ncbi:MAG TPA: CCA tRNA nucleotidyltransferase [Rickettsia endosymbiont of Pyrocoelia pectoralis]|nr:CCA tRNA nucleotidyltransferase [Rickettsia endosymbiont of Pyrocoelia pectoralis]